MKKFLVLFVGLAILAGSVCALDLPDALKIPGLDVSGNVRTGFRVTGYATQDLGDNDGTTSTPVAEAYSDDPDDGHPIRAQLVLQWTKGNLGVKTRFRWQPDGLDLSSDGTKANLVDVAGVVNKAFVWGDVLDKKVRVTAGKGLDGTWSYPWGDLSPSDTGNFDDTDGLKVEVKPIDGLNLGVFYGTDNLFSAGVTDEGRADRRFVAGAKYGSDRFGLAASLYWNPSDGDYVLLNADGDPAYVDLSSALPRTSNLLIGGQVKASDAVTLSVNIGFTNLGSDTVSDAFYGGNDIEDYKSGDYNPYWFFFGKLNGEYAASDALSVGLTVSDVRVGDGYFYADGDAEEVEDRGLGQFFPITLSPYVGYTLNDDISLGGELGFKINTGGSDQFGFKVKPSAEFSLGSGASFTVYDTLEFYTESKWKKESVDPDNTGTYVAKHRGVADVLNLDGHSGSKNTFHIEFAWSF